MRCYAKLTNISSESGWPAWIFMWQSGCVVYEFNKCFIFLSQFSYDRLGKRMFFKLLMWKRSTETRASSYASNDWPHASFSLSVCRETSQTSPWFCLTNGGNRFLTRSDQNEPKNPSLIFIQRFCFFKFGWGFFLPTGVWCFFLTGHARLD